MTLERPNTKTRSVLHARALEWMTMLWLATVAILGWFWWENLVLKEQRDSMSDQARRIVAQMAQAQEAQEFLTKHGEDLHEQAMLVDHLMAQCAKHGWVWEPFTNHIKGYTRVQMPGTYAYQKRTNR